MAEGVLCCVKARDGPFLDDDFVGGLARGFSLGEDVRVGANLSKGRLFTVVPSRRKAPRPVLALGRGGFLSGGDE